MYYVGAGFFGFALFGGLISTIGNVNNSRFGSSELAILAIAGSIYLVLTVLFGWIGHGLRRLEKRTRWPVMILSTIGLLLFPFGTIINGYVLYLVGSKKGKFIMTPEYQRIRQATPHIQYKSSFLVLLLVGY